jgi:hypothetical protein
MAEHSSSSILEIGTEHTHFPISYMYLREKGVHLLYLSHFYSHFSINRSWSDMH